jgi:SAM-dependent methyltransferase
MQEIFHSNTVFLLEKRQTDFTLYEEICDLIFEDIETIRPIYQLPPLKTFLDLNPKNGYFKSLFSEITEDEKNPDIISCILKLHKTNKINEVLKEIKALLKSGGMFVGTFFGVENLLEVRELIGKLDIKLSGRAFPRFLPVIDIKTIGMMLQSVGFKNVVVSSLKLEYKFNNLHEGLKFLKKNGETNCLTMRDFTFYSGNILRKNLENYSKEVILSFDVCFFSCLA